MAYVMAGNYPRAGISLRRAMARPHGVAGTSRPPRPAPPATSTSRLSNGAFQRAPGMPPHPAATPAPASGSARPHGALTAQGR
ncbi:hypothetical protein GCM10010191_92790 [Actinomadura vinacea]|uniref:Uncharacterized protein n=1 Tax=Actinomadura vinacea TaxID=115336 RepID=A0ABN3KIS3_9ACTN